MKLRRGLLWLVMLALVAAQGIGLMHRIVHGAHNSTSHTVVACNVQCEDARKADGHWITSLFEGHSDDSSCRLFDPLNHDCVYVMPIVLAPLVPATFVINSLQGEFLARWAALFQARGPPTTR